MVVLVILAIIIVATIVFVNEGQRHLLGTYAKQQLGRRMRAVERQERFSSEADSETVLLFAEDVKEAHSEFLMALETIFRG